MMNENCIHDLNLTTDEIRRFGDAFSDGKFRELFNRYLQEINNPDNQKVFENEITQLEHERGNDIQFVKPVPGYVLKTSADNSRKIYINICSSEKIGEMQSNPTVKDKIHGKNVLIPHALTPLQKVLDKHKVSVCVYTVVFHSDTLEKAMCNPHIKRCVNESALEIIEKSFNVLLDKVNFCVSKKLFKGIAELTTIRKPNTSCNKEPVCEFEDPHNVDEYVKPVYRIKYRKEVDIQNSTMDRYCKMNVLVPKEMIVEIELPLLKSTQDTHLDVQANSITLFNEKPNYKLTINLPYEVNKDDGKAKFDSFTHILQMELKVIKKERVLLDSVEQKPMFNLITEINSSRIPVNPNENEVRIDNEESRGFVKCPFSSTSNDENSDVNSRFKKSHSDANSGFKKFHDLHFLHSDIKYKLPSFGCNYYQHKLSFTIHVKNVNYDSFDYQLFEKCDGFWVKFCSLGAGHFPMFYAMCVVFQRDMETIASLEYFVENEKVYMYVKLRSEFVPLEYYVGIDPCNLKKHYLNEPDAVLLEVEDKKMETLEVDIGVSKFTPEEVLVDVVLRPDCLMITENSFAVPITSTTTVSTNECASTLSTAGHTSMIFDNFEKFDQLKKKMSERQITPEKLDFEMEFAETTNFRTFCDDFTDRFSLDEESHCMSENELLSARSCDRGRKGGARLATVSNRSWIVDSKNGKKAKRRKKAKDKKQFSNGNSDFGSGGGGGGGCESETERTDSPKAADNSFSSSNFENVDVKTEHQFSNLSGRSILKKNRSFSESSGDELCQVECSRSYSYSVEDINFSSDSYSQSVPKKTVRFNDVILKKLYSSDISILEQRKRSKRRLQRKERKASDSDNSETESSASISNKRENIRLYNENLGSGNLETELTSLSESGDETSDDHSDNPDTDIKMRDDIPCSKKNHKRRGKKSARKNASTAKHQFPNDE